LEEINYYLDRVIPVLKRDAPLSESFGRKEGRLVLMSKKVYENIQNKENLSLILIREFHYKKGKLVLISS
jgi:hypothetical protein